MHTKSLAALAVAALAAPGAAHAAELHVGPTPFGSTPRAAGTLVGLTSQSPCEYGGAGCGDVNVTPHRNGRSIRHLAIGWEASCDQLDMVMHGDAVAEAVKIKRTPAGGSFKVGDRYIVGWGDGYFARIDEAFTGKIDKRRRVARGTFSSVAVVMHGGRQVDRCATGRVMWKATRVR